MLVLPEGHFSSLQQLNQFLDEHDITVDIAELESLLDTAQSYRALIEDGVLILDPAYALE